MRILVYSHFYPPEIGGAAARVHGLCKWLVAMGHEVTVISSHPHYASGFEDPDDRFRFWRKKTEAGINVVTTWVYAPKKFSKWRRLANYFSFVLSGTLAGLFTSRHDVVIATSPPLFLGLAGWATALTHRCPWILDVRDIWPQVAVEAGAFEADSVIVKWGERLERWLYRSAERITVVTKNKRECLVSKGVDPQKIRLVENGVDFDLLERWTQQPSDTIDWHQLEGKLIFAYAGLMGVFQGLDRIVDAASSLTDLDQAHFLLVGDGVKKPELVQQAEHLGLRNVTFVPPQARSAVPGIIARSNVMLVPLASEQLADAVPSKLLEAWACQRPVILLGGGEARQLVELSGGGYCVTPGDRPALVATLRKIVDDPTVVNAMGDSGYNFVKQRFDRRDLAGRMEEACREVVKTKGADLQTTRPS